MIYLSEEVIDQTVSMKEVMDGIDQAYAVYEEENFNMPTRFRVQDKNNTMVLMPCFVEDYITTKLVTIFPKNTEQNMPALNGLVALHCNKTGIAKALMDGTFITGIRTGAVGGSAIRHLAREDVRKLAVIGTGVQGYFQTLAACEARDFTDIYIYNRTGGEKVEKFVIELKKDLDPNIQIHISNSAQEAVEHAEVVITATTSNEPVIPNDVRLVENKLFVGIGSFQPNMREFPQAVFENASKMYIDTVDAMKESGDIIDPLEKTWMSKEQVQTFSSYLAEDSTPMKNGETVIFKSTGMALFDAVVSAVIYEKAIEKQLGINL